MNMPEFDYKCSECPEDFGSDLDKAVKHTDDTTHEVWIYEQ